MSVPPPNYTQVPNVLLDAIGELSDAELRVAMAICRQTFGWHKERDALSLSQLQRLTGRSRPVVSDGINGLMQRGWVERTPIKKRGGTSYAYRLAIEAIGEEPARDPPEVVGYATSSPGYQYPSLPLGDEQQTRELPRQDAEKREVVGYATSSLAYPQKKDHERKNPPPPTPSPDAASPGGGGGGGSVNQETRQALQAAGVRSVRALQRLGVIDPAVVRRTVDALAGAAGIKSAPGALVGALDAYLATGEELAPAAPAAPERPPSDAAILAAPLDAQGRAAWLARFRQAPTPAAKRVILDRLAAETARPAPPPEGL